MAKGILDLHIPTIDLLSWTFERADSFQEKPIFINAHKPLKRFSCNDVKNNVRYIVSGLRSFGIERGDTVCVLSFNHIFYSTFYFGIIGTGACFVGANPAYTHQELQHLLSISKAKLIIVEHDLLSNILSAALECNIPPSKVFAIHPPSEQLPDGVSSWRTLFEHGQQDWITFDNELEAKNTIASLMLTSGTTGLPKAAAISHYAQLAQAVMLYDSKDKCYEVKRLLSLPQFHSFTATLAHIAPLREGHTTYIMKRHHADQYLEYIKLYQITETAMVPPIVLNYLARPPPDQKLLSSLRYIWCAGAPLSASTHERILHVLDPAAIFSQVWGMSETGWITTFHFSESDDSGSVGRLLPNMEAKIMGKNNEEILEDMQPGEILVRGPSLMSGYLGNAQATRSCFVNGWLKTGDIGYRRNGKWYITDRAKELIKVRAWQVSPTELETCLLAHSSIIDAAVVGVQISEVAGELPRGYVVLNPKSNGQVTEMEIQQHIQKRLAKYKALDAGVKFVDSIPRGASGKILREKLKKRALEEIKKENDVNGLINGGINGVRAQGEQKEHT